MTSRTERAPLPRFVLPGLVLPRFLLPGLVLSLLALLVLAPVAASPEQLLLTLALACALGVTTTLFLAPTPQLISVHRRSERTRATGIRSTDPDRAGHPRPRAPGTDS